MKSLQVTTAAVQVHEGATAGAVKEAEAGAGAVTPGADQTTIASV